MAGLARFVGASPTLTRHSPQHSRSKSQPSSGAWLFSSDTLLNRRDKSLRTSFTNSAVPRSQKMGIATVGRSVDEDRHREPVYLRSFEVGSA
jgi:hypothetical protein